MRVDPPLPLRRPGPDARPPEINRMLWAVLCLAPADGEPLAETLELAAKLNEDTGYENAGYLDTLARAWFLNGDFEEAIDFQRAALEAGPTDSSRVFMEARLARYEASEDRR